MRCSEMRQLNHSQLKKLSEKKREINAPECIDYDYKRAIVGLNAVAECKWGPSMHWTGESTKEIINLNDLKIITSALPNKFEEKRNGNRNSEIQPR